MRLCKINRIFAKILENLTVDFSSEQILNFGIDKPVAVAVNWTQTTMETERKKQWILRYIMRKHFPVK